MVGIYKFTNKITNESYVGQSVDIKKRYIQHKNRYEEINGKCALENSYFHSMLRKYGFDNFDFEIVEECQRKELNDKEIFYIEYFGTLYPNGYNLSAGGTLPHVNLLRDVDAVNEIKKLLRTTDISNIEIGRMYEVSDQTISDINCGRTWFDEDVNYPIRNGRKNSRREDSGNRKIYYCNNCGKEIFDETKTGMCMECYLKFRRRNIPDKQTLIELLSNNSFAHVASKFGVTNNAVRKWCDSYNIPRRSKYYRSVS